MRSREEGGAKIRNFVARFNALATASGGRIARVGSLLSDGAKELVSNEVQEYLDDVGADKKESPPGVHALNGCAERGILSVFQTCLLYTSPSPRDLSTSRMPSSA